MRRGVNALCRTLALLLVAACAHTSTRTQGPSFCLPTGPTGENILDRVQSIVTHPDSGSRAARAALDLPPLAASEVQAVTNEEVCSKMASAHATVQSTAPHPLFVIRVGATRYVVWDPTVRVGEFDAAFVYSSDYALLIGFTQ